MGDLVNLKKTGSGWEFESEAALEDFVWANLPELFGLTPLKRQYAVKGQICDILGLDENRQLTVLELKNVEDRYIIQQLTRYYDALGEEKPFAEEVDCDRPIRLIAVTPNFHRDNYTDRKYCHLDIQFLQFQVLVDGEKFYLQLKDVDNEKVWRVEIPYQERESNHNIPEPPRALIKLIAKCTSEQKEGILEIREKILQFDSRMQETTSTASINYGRGKSKPCAELRFDSTRNCPALFLWLPLVSSGWKKKNFIARMRVWTDWKIVSDVGHVPEAFGRMISLDEWKLGNVRPLIELLPSYKEDRELFWNDKEYRERHVKNNLVYYDNNESYKSPLAMRINYYSKIIDKPEELNNLDKLVDLALERWLEKL